MTSAARVTTLPQAPPPAAPPAPLGPAQSVQQAVGQVLSPVVGAIDSLNLGVARMTEGFAKLFPKMGAARLWSDIVFQFGHMHPHPPTFGFPLPSVGPILAAGAQGVLINGFPAARCGDLGLSVWCGGYFPIFEILTGSSHVFIGGARASRTLLDPTLHCLPVIGKAGLGGLGAAMMALSAGLSALNLLASMEGADAAAADAGSAQAESAAAAESSEMAQAQLVALEGTEEEAGATIVATTTAMDAASAAAMADATAAYAAAQGVGVATAAKQLAADIVGLAMSALIGKDPGVGFPFGLIITGSSNVVIGGFPMPGWALILKGLGKLLKAASRGIQLVLPKGWKLRKALCRATGHPVDVATGRMFTSQTDFEIDGRIPVFFERTYDTSAIDYEGPLGWGWTHTYDVHLWEDHNQGMVVVRDQEARVIGFKLLEVGEKTYNPLEKLWLERTGECEYELEDPGIGIRRRFGVGESGSTQSVGTSEREPLRLIAVLDRNDNALRLEYRQGLLFALDDECGCRVLFTYSRHSNGKNRLVEVRQQIQHSDGKSFRLAHYAYNDHGELAEAADRNRIPWRYYYEDRLMIREMNRNGLNFYFEYEGTGASAQCVHTWGDGGIYERWIKYNPRARVTAVTDGLGRMSICHFNDLNLVVKEFDALGGVKQFEYGPVGELLKETDEILRTRTYRYDEYYNCSGVVQEDGSTQRVAYNQQSRPVSIEDEMGGLWRREYDAAGNIIATIDTVGARREFKYNTSGDVGELRDALGRITQVNWDRAGQLKTTIRPSGVRSLYTHDERRLLIEARDEASGLSVKYDYDRVGRLIRVRDIDTHGQTVSTEQYEYDPEGNLIRDVDGLGHATRYRYRGFNKVVERTDALGHHRRVEYDREERVLCIENEREESYRVQYDMLDRVIREVDFDGSLREFGYDAAGQLSEQRDALGRVTHYLRDPAGRVLKKLRADLTSVEYVYDPCGRLVEARNDDSQVTLAYDAAWRLIQEEQNGNIIEYDYDAEDQRVARRVTLASGETTEAQKNAGQPSLVEYEYDDDGSLTKIRAAGEEISYRRDRAGRLTERALPNGLVETYRYDSSGRLAGQQVSARLAGDDLVRRAYRWDSAGNLAEVQDSRRGSRRYSYDAVDRLQRVERSATGRAELKGESGPQGGFRGAELPPERRLWLGSDDEWSRRPVADQREVEEFQYDVDGNLLERNTNRGVKRSFAYGRGDRLDRADETRLIYDAAGNLIEKRRPNGTSIFYKYDVDDQLIAVSDTDGDLIEFSYDALGRRRAKRNGVGRVGFLWDGDVLLGEQHTDRSEGHFRGRLEYVQPPGSFVPSGRLCWKADGSFESQAYHVDYLGTPREVTDRNGQLEWKADYDEYGRAEISEAKVPQSIRFQGQYEDTETGLHYNWYRYYDPESGRYISKDPIGLMGGLNHYEYTHNPINWVDPFGLKTWTYHNMPGIDGYQKHHIIPQQLRDHPAFQKSGVGIHQRGNIIYLPKSADVHPTRTVHSGSHPLYTAGVRSELDRIDRLGRRLGWNQAQYKVAVEDVMAQKRSGLRRGEISLNKNSKRQVC